MRASAPPWWPFPHGFPAGFGEVPVEEGAEVPRGLPLVQLDDEMALIHAGLLRKAEALEAEHDSLARQRTMAARQTASRQAGQAAELRAAEAKAQAYAHDREQAATAFRRGSSCSLRAPFPPRLMSS